MARILLLIVASLTLVFAEQDLEVIANNVLAGVHSHLGGESGSNSLYSSLTSSEFAKVAALELNKTRRETIEEGLGSEGITFVSVTRGKKQVNVTTVYGLGAGAVVRAREDTKGQEVVEPSFEELDQVYQPLYEKYVKAYESEDSNPDTVRVILGDRKRSEFGLRDRRERIEARVAAGFRVGAKTTVSKRG